MSTVMRGWRRLSTKRRWLLAGTVCGLGVIASESVAFACSNIMGPLTFSPTSGPAGSVVYTNASGLKPYPARYQLFFGGTCMTSTGKLLKTITTNTSGAWTHKKVVIPMVAPGSYSLCGIEAYPVPGGSATSHDEFTVV